MVCADTRMPPDAGDFGARIFKIGADESGARMTYLKVTDGAGKSTNLVSRPDARVEFEEKADQSWVTPATIPPGQRSPGTVCAVLGPAKTYPGQGPWRTTDARQPMLEPVLNYRVERQEGADPTVPFWPCTHPGGRGSHSRMWCGTPLWARSTCKR